MKPIQNQYQDLLEGKMSKSNFLTNVKRSLSDYVSNITSFDDAVKILKSKRILSENISNTAQMGGVTTSKGSAGYINNPDKKGGDYNPKERAANLARLRNSGPKKEKPLKEMLQHKLKPGHMYAYTGGAENAELKYIGKSQDNPDIRIGSSMGKGHIFQWPDGKYFELGPISIGKYINMLDSDPRDEEMVKRYDDEQDAKHALPGANAYYNESKAKTKYLKEGTSIGIKAIVEADKYNPIEYKNGIDYELDLVGDFSAEGLQKAVNKVLKNLAKDSIYYTNLKANLTQKINKKQVQATELVQVKKDNHTDQLNKVKTLVKKEMANTKTTLSKKEKASNATPKGVKLMKEEEGKFDLNKHNKDLFKKQSEDLTKKLTKPVTQKNTLKDKIKEYVTKQLKKEAVKFTIGATGQEHEYKNPKDAPEFEKDLKSAGVKFTKTSV